MKFDVLVLGMIVSSVLSCGGSNRPLLKKESIVTPPTATKVSHTWTEHGVEREDPYSWMRDDKRENEQVLSQLRRENAHVETMLQSTEELQKELLAEMKARIKEDDSSPPYQEDGYLRYSRFEKNKEYAIYCRKKVLANGLGEEEILMDANQRAVGHEYYSLGTLVASPDNSLVAFSEDTVSRRQYVTRFKDLKSGQILKDEIQNTNPGAVWSTDGKSIYYVKKDTKTLRAFQVWRHILGQTEDQLIFEETDDEFFVRIGRSRSKKYLMISSRQTVSSEVNLVDLSDDKATVKTLLPRRRNHEYRADHFGNDFYLLTNQSHKDFELLKMPERLWNTTMSGFTGKTLAGGEPGVFVANFAIFNKAVAVGVRRDALLQIDVVDHNGAALQAPEPADDVFVMSLDVNRDPATTKLRYAYGSLAQPQQTVEFDFLSGTRKLLKEQPVLGKFSSKDYVTKRSFAIANDGKKIPLSIVHRADLDLSKPNPTHLYGYGSYGHTVDPWFRPTRISLLDRGFIFVVAHIRGSSAYGRGWYEDGKLLNKRNTFSDFIASAEYLISENLTTSELLYAEGRSAGGLLIGAVANMRPDLFHGMIAGVPFVDVVTTMFDEGIPLTTFEYDEWGNPNNKEYFDYMLTYSPYENVSAKAYPHMLVLTGLYDSQVQYWEPMKWVARLRELTTGRNDLLFKTDMEAGHGGASGRFKALEEVALVQAFMLSRLR